MKIKTLFFMALIGALLPLSSLQAWDGKRQGFLLGLGAGAGSLEYTDVQSVHLNDENRSDELSTIAFMPKVGYAPSDRFALLYYRHPFLFDAKNAQGTSQELTACVELLGLHYYFDSGPSLYVGAGWGNSYFFEGLENTAESALKGSGSALSIGYEFSEHYSLELTSITGTLDDQGGSFKGYALTLNVLGY